MYFGTNIDYDPFVCTRLVDSNRSTKDLDLIHDLDSIVCILFGLEFAEPVALVGLRDSVFGKMDADNGADLEHEFPYQGVCCFLINVANVDSSILVALVVREADRHDPQILDSDLLNHKVGLYNN
jgi:hypothetical protein